LLGMNSREAGFMPTGDAVKRRTLIEIFRRLKEFRLVTLLVSEKPESGDTLSRDGIAEFICDGVLTMNYSPEKEDSFATLQIRKMRGMKHRREEFRTNLKSDGIWVEVDDKRLQ